MKNYKNAVDKVYEQLDDFVVIGLTGRTGSGCTTLSKILETTKFEDLDLSTPKKKDFYNIEERKNAIIYKYMRDQWTPFITIEMSSIILSFVLERPYNEFEEFINKLSIDNDNNFRIGGFEDLKKRMSGLESLFNNNIKIDSEHSTEVFEYYTKKIKQKKKIFSDLFKEFSYYECSKSSFSKKKEKKSQLYTYLLQTFGNNIRSSGNPYDSSFNDAVFDLIAKRVSLIIDIIKENDLGSRFCIDAIRNPYEAYYFRDKYKNFYLISVSTDDEERISRLSGFDEQELLSLDSMEYPVEFEAGKIFFQQSIQECLQMSDIHLYNPHSNDSTYEELTTNALRYIALMRHPGLVTPTSIERCMQVAFNAKLNSGCLSRQVGAAITDENYYIKAIGWNEVPQGQVSCSLRSIFNYFSDRDKNTFSKFELENQDFKGALKNIKNAYSCKECETLTAQYSIPYCFKDVYNAIKSDKNQVYTRSLHAEENAFLQLAKFGGEGILGGKLFVTASPCELCSKKSYQLGIRDIYYIDPYPGIASSHILKLGDKETNPNLHIFYGAVGNAYVSLYSQRFAVKDELQLLSGIKVKESTKIKERNIKQTYKENKFKNISLELILNNRVDIDFIQSATLIPVEKDLRILTKKISWTGSTYEKTEIIDNSESYSIKDESNEDGIVKFNIVPNDSVAVGNEFNYSIKTSVKDDKLIMIPMLSHHVKAKTDKLELLVKFNKDNLRKPSNTKLVLYADMNENVVFSEESIKIVEENGFYVIKKVIEKPYLLYTYSIEWSF